MDCVKMVLKEDQTMLNLPNLKTVIVWPSLY